MLTLDLIELADLVRPEQLVDEILKQNPNITLPVPIEDLARLAGISKIEAITSEGFEGALISNPEKSEGAIFFNANRPRPRRRFTIGHELGHFLLPWHRQTSFSCTSDDISSRANADWEIQANQFSAELLMPRQLVKRRLVSNKDPELAHITALTEEFETSFEMASRRLTELSEYACAIVFSKDNEVRYSVKSDNFTEKLCLRKGSTLPSKSFSRQKETDPEEWFEIDATWWLQVRKGLEFPESVYEQTLCQDDGYKVTLLAYD
jgi:Zn-dependent peptidase ImmA (M78 family)